MPNPEHLDLLWKGSEAWNKWRKAFPEIKPDLGEADLSEGYLHGANLTGANLTGANLSGADLRRADLTAARLIHADLTRADLSRALLNNASFGGANLSRANLSDAHLRTAALNEANLTGADLRRADLSHGYLRRADLSRADLSGANLRRATLNAVFKAARFIGADLSGTELRYADLTDADLQGANLGCARLAHADLGGADLRGANLGGADLTYASLSRANLNGANLNAAIFEGANLAGARFGSTNITEVDLSEARGLELTRHDIPSSVGIDTIYKSRGGIPEHFLRGAGVPDELIAYLPQLLRPGIDSCLCFISYSQNDEEFCQQLHSRLQAEHLQVWSAPEETKNQEKSYEQMDREIRLYGKLLLVLSETSMHSEWIGPEIRCARLCELREKHRIIFPIRLCPFEELRAWRKFDSNSGNDVGREVREYFIADFSNWKDPDAFETSFACLLNDLRGETAPSPTPP